MLKDLPITLLLHSSSSIFIVLLGSPLAAHLMAASLPGVLFKNIHNIKLHKTNTNYNQENSNITVTFKILPSERT